MNSCGLGDTCIVCARRQRIGGRPKEESALGLADVTRTDLTLLHAPSVYDFREKTMMMGPVADAVPSTDEFEMYPVGMTSIATYLGRNHYNVRIVNLAYRMLRDSSFDVAGRLRGMRSTVFGIDLHWLPHAQGALAVGELVKRLHPQSYLLYGGLSSSYYHRELVRYPFVDFVLRGDSTEEPCRQLLSALRRGEPLESVENLTWKRRGGEVVVNPLTFVPTDLDYVNVPDYLYAIMTVFKYRSLEDIAPYVRWLKHPTTMLLGARGCSFDCAVCGGSKSAYREICHRSEPAFRSPEKLISDVRSIRLFSRGPIMLIHDPRIGGLGRARRFFSLLKEERVSNELIFELFYPADGRFFDMVRESVPRWSLQVSIETPVESLRRHDRLKFQVPNAKVEETLAGALSSGCNRLDLFFMTGLPHQTYEDAMEVVPYCEHLVERFGADRRLRFFVSPLGPFLDPGCDAFEDPGHGCKSFHRTLEDHRRALLMQTWRSVLSYETDSMNRDQIIAASYDAAAAMNELKFKHHLIDEGTYRWVVSQQKMARELMALIEGALLLPEREREEALGRIQSSVDGAKMDTLFSKRELDWPSGGGLRVGPSLLWALASGFVREAAYGLNRMAGRYDTDVYSGTRMLTDEFENPLNPPLPVEAVGSRRS
ncbi:MAG TPA: TIGR04190 family B12-binding domain/radical SAM domain protein [Nitrososphaerales archaeon]|nr:TIGR04190 family B12-binding domain/radical SAM domain protein [Nitrososphaerales archaeon]